MGTTIRTRLMSRLARHAGLRFFRFFERPLDAHARPALPATATIRFLERDETAALCVQGDLDLRRDNVVAAFRRGDLCVGAFDGDAIAGYCWLAFAPLHHLDGVSVKFAADVAWIYKSLVRPAYRGRGIAAALYVHADASCRERGRRCSLICVESHNKPSVVAATRAGYRSAGRAAYVRRGPVFADWYSPALVQRYGVSFFLPD